MTSLIKQLFLIVPRLVQRINLQLIMYIFVGFIGAIIEWSLFILLNKLFHSILLANVIAFHLAFLTCFFLHHFLTYKLPFQGILPIFKILSKYWLLMYIQLALGTSILYLLLNVLTYPIEISKILQILLLVPPSYWLQKKLVFI